jgi:hypothetical protein
LRSSNIESQPGVPALEDNQEALSHYINSIRIIDTHEHVSSPKFAENTPLSIFDFIFGIYLRDDLASTGLKRNFWRSNLVKEEKWARLKQHLAKVRNTTYFHAFEIILQDLFDLEGSIFEIGWEAISSRLAESRVKGEEWYDYVLRDRGKIALCLIDKGQTTDFEIQLALTASPESVYVKESPEKSDYDLFKPVLRIDLFAHAFRHGATAAIAEKFNVLVRTFEEFEAFLHGLIPNLRKRGFVAIKSLLAYTSGLDHTDPDRDRAARAWRKGDDADDLEQRCFRDYVVWLLSELAAQGNLTFEIHTGMSCCGARYPQKAAPHELTRLIYSNPKTHYDIFHAGYPCIEQAAAIVKNFPNAFLNLNWLPVISFETARRYVGEVLDTVPMTKISWGGDGVLVEEAYAHAKLMRELLISVLSEKTVSGRYDEELCRQIAMGILRANAIELYHV